MVSGSDVGLTFRDVAPAAATPRLPTRGPTTAEGSATLVGARGPLTAEVVAVAAARATVLAARPDAAILTGQIGVGVLGAAAVLASLPAGVLGQPKAAAAYAGRHPRHAQAGQRDRRRRSKQGCPALRR